MGQGGTQFGLPDERKTGLSGRHLFSLFSSSGMLALAVATQVLAADFRYPAHFGPSFHGVYLPWAILDWSSKWAQARPEPFNRAFAFGAGAFVAAMLVLVIVNRGLSKRASIVHGSARWATRKDLRRAALVETPRSSKKGSAALEPYLYLGAWKSEGGEMSYLRHRGSGHAMVMAATGKGKGINLVIPNLLSWTGCMFALDIKGELFDKTAGWREKYAKNRVLRFEPLSPTNTVRWNVLDEVRVGTDFMVGDVQNICKILGDPTGKPRLDHFDHTGMALVEALVLHVLLKREREGCDASLPEVARLAFNPVDGLWQEMRDYPHENGRPHPLVKLQAQSMIARLEKGGEEASSTIATVQTFLGLYRNPVVARNTSVSDFSVRTLMDGSKPVSLYFVTQVEDKDAAMPLTRLFLDMTLRALAPRAEEGAGNTKQAHKYPMLMMLDEILALGKLARLQESLAYIRSFRIRCVLIVQDRSMLLSDTEGYGRNESLTGNCNFLFAFGPNNQETAEYLSKMLGNTTVEEMQLTVANGRRSRTFQKIKRALLDPDEIRRLPPYVMEGGEVVKGGNALLLAEATPGVMVDVVPYFLDETFSARAAIPATKMSEPEDASW